MSAHSASSGPGNQRLLGEMLHSLSQPLTSLRCALELSVLEDRTQQSVSVALEQTETVIRMVRLMREYLDSEPREMELPAVALMPVLRNVGEDLSSVAAVEGVHLQITGTSQITLRVHETRLHVALQYLIRDLIERQMAGNKVIILVRDDATETVLLAQGEHMLHRPHVIAGQARLTTLPSIKRSNERLLSHDSASATMRRVRLAIASQVLENAGAEVKLKEDTPGFVVRIPRRDNPAV